MPIKNQLPVELPDIPGLSTDPREILDRMVATYEATHLEETGTAITLASGDPMRIFLQTNALVAYQLENLIKYFASQNYLTYAQGPFLDSISATRGGPIRSGQSYAVVTMRFTFAVPLPQAVAIPIDTRVTPDGNIFFATTEVHTLTAGATSWEGVFTCQTSGEVGNGFLPGQITTLVDPLPYEQTVVNTDTSQGGADEETDAHYAEVIYLSPEGYSVAGPELAYEYLAKTFSAAIMDVKAHSPSPGDVYVVPLLQGGEIPTPAFLSELLDYLSPKDKRPVTDNVQAAAPVVVPFNVAFTYYVESSQANSQVEIQAAVEQAAQDYTAWQKARMGRDVNPQELIRRVLAAGAKRLDITEPVYTVVDPYAVAIASAPVIAYGGLEDE